MNIQHVPKSSGAQAHWLVTLNPDTTVIDVAQWKDRQGVTIGETSAGGSPVVTDILAGQGSMAVVLPVGAWRVGRSSDGVRYRTLTTLDSVNNPPYGPSQRINTILDGRKFPPVWARYTKVVAKPLSKVKRR